MQGKCYLFNPSLLNVHACFPIDVYMYILCRSKSTFNSCLANCRNDTSVKYATQIKIYQLHSFYDTFTNCPAFMIHSLSLCIWSSKVLSNSTKRKSKAWLFFSNFFLVSHWTYHSLSTLRVWEPENRNKQIAM